MGPPSAASGVTERLNVNDAIFPRDGSELHIIFDLKLRQQVATVVRDGLDTQIQSRADGIGRKSTGDVLSNIFADVTIACAYLAYAPTSSSVSAFLPT